MKRADTPKKRVESVFPLSVNAQTLEDWFREMENGTLVRVIRTADGKGLMLERRRPHQFFMIELPTEEP